MTRELFLGDSGQVEFQFVDGRLTVRVTLAGDRGTVGFRLDAAETQRVRRLLEEPERDR